VLAVDWALAGEPAQEVVALAERMLDGDRLPSGQIAAQTPPFAINALIAERSACGGFAESV
jgi:hypothetical protein